MERRNAEDGKAGEGGDCDAMDGRDGEGSEAEPYLDLFQRNKSRTKEKRREKRDRHTDIHSSTKTWLRVRYHLLARGLVTKASLPTVEVGPTFDVKERRIQIANE